MHTHSVAINIYRSWLLKLFFWLGRKSCIRNNIAQCPCDTSFVAPLHDIRCITKAHCLIAEKIK